MLTNIAAVAFICSLPDECNSNILLLALFCSPTAREISVSQFGAGQVVFSAFFPAVKGCLPRLKTALIRAVRLSQNSVNLWNSKTKTMS